MMRVKRILVPVDFSKESELAAEWAVKLAKEETDSAIYLLHVLKQIPVVEGELQMAKMAEAQWDSAKEQLEQWRGKIPPPLSSFALVTVADPLKQITWVCEEHDIDLVVMTTHGRHGLTRFVHPNLSERVVREAPCPVLVLHLNSKIAATAKSSA